jgi:2-dehydropantoate 2-reductase
MKIGIVGAGGIGSYYAGLLSRAGHSVRLIARGEHLRAIRDNGLEVGLPGEKFVARLEATESGDALIGCDFVIVAVKSYSIPEVGKALAAAAKSGAVIVPLLNGVDVADRLESAGVPRDSIAAGLVAASLVRTGPGKVERRSPFERVIIGELSDRPSTRVQPLVDALVAAGSSARVSTEMKLDLWRKFAFIVPMNVGAGLARGPVGLMLATERGRAIMTGSLAEIVAVSVAAGTPLTADEEKIRTDLLALPPSTRPSFLADLERGGPTELDLLVGNVSRMGRVYGVPTPIHDVATAAFEAATQQT